MSKNKFSDYKKPQYSVSKALADTGVFDSDLSKAFYGTTLDRFFSKTEIARYVGKIGSTAYDLRCDSSYIQESDPYNQANQLQVVAHAPIGAEDKFLTFKDFMQRLESLGVDLRKFQQWGNLESFNYVPPINLDKFSNYADYYWCPPTPNLGPEYITIANPTRQVADKSIHLLSRNADYVSVSTPIGAPQLSIWLDTNTQTLKQYIGTHWVEIDSLSYIVRDVDTANQTIVVDGDVSQRLQKDSVLYIESTELYVATLALVTTIEYDSAAHRTTLGVKYNGEYGDLRDREIFIDAALKIVLSERANYTDPDQVEFRVRPTTVFAYHDLPDIVWAKYTNVLTSNNGRTELGSTQFLENPDNNPYFARFVDRGTRAGDFVQIKNQPNRGLYEIDAIVGDLTLATIMPNERGAFFDQMYTDYAIIRGRTLTDITGKTPPLSPIVGEYWIDTDSNVLRQYFPPGGIDPDTCPNLDQVWVPVLYQFSLLTAALGSRYISNYYPASNPWAETNYWRHRSAVTALAISDARQAQLPIIEYNDGLELSEWRKTVHGWSYRPSADQAFKPTTYIPNLNELQTFDVYSPETLVQLSLGGTYGDRSSEFLAGSKFRITDSLGGQLDGIYKVKSTLFVRYSDNEFRTQITLDPSTPLRAAFSLPGGRITPIATSRGDGWNGYDTHWRYDGIKSVLMTAPHQLSVRHLASNNVIRTYSDTQNSYKVALSFVELKANKAGTLNVIDLPIELLERSVYNSVSNSTLVYVNGKRITAYKDVESGVSGGYVGQVFFTTPIKLAINDVVRVEVGPVTNLDIGRTHVPVFNGSTVEFVDLTEYRIVPQIKAEINQYPLFSVYTADQQPVDRASSLFEYLTDEQTGVFNFWIQRRMAISADGEYQFKLTLQRDDTPELFACKDRGVRYTEQDDSELRSIWYSNPANPVFVSPEFVDSCGRPACILTDGGDLNPDGYWQVPTFWTTNLVNETRQILTAGDLTSHFRSIISSQVLADLPPEEREVYFVNSSPNLGLGGTIKLFNYGPGLSISTLMLEQTDPIDVIQQAHDAYEHLLASITERGRREFADAFGNNTSVSRSTFIDGIINNTISSFENNDEMNRVYGDSINSSKLKNFVDTLPAFGLTAYTIPQIISVGGDEHLVHHDGHLTKLIFNNAQIRAMLVNLIKRHVRTALKYLVSSGGFDPTIIPKRGNDSLSVFFVQQEYQTTSNSGTPPVLLPPTIFVKREVVAANGLVTFETYTPSTFTILNPERVPSPDHLVVYDPTIGDWVIEDTAQLYVEMEKKLLLAVERRLYNVQSTVLPQYNVKTVIPDTNWSSLQHKRFNAWVSNNTVESPYSSIFKSDDPFTWNYIGAVVRSFPQLRTTTMYANWQSIYEHFYGTAYPHLEPWKLQHYNTKPLWWDEEYKDTTGTRRWTERMWFNIVFGTIPVGRYGPNGVSLSTLEDQQLVAGYAYIPVNTTSTTLVVIDPLVSLYPQTYKADEVLPPYIDMTQSTSFPTWMRSLFNKDSLTGLPESSFPNREAAYTFGVRGPSEFAWRKSSQYLYDQLIVAWQIDPIRFTYKMMGFEIDTIGRVQLDKNTRTIHNHTMTQFHGDYVNRNSVQVVRSPGLNQWYINYFRMIRQDATEGDFRRLWTTWQPHLSYMFNRVVNEDTIQLTSPTSEIVSGDYSIRLKNTRELDIFEHAGLKVQVLSAPSKYSPLRSTGKGWEFAVTTYSPFTNDISIRELENYFVTPGKPSDSDSHKWYINRFNIVGVDRYTPHAYQVINYAGGWSSYDYVTSVSNSIHTFNVLYTNATTAVPITITVDGSDPTNNTIGGLLQTLNIGLIDSDNTRVGTFALRNGNIVLYSFNRNVVGRIVLDAGAVDFFGSLAPTNPTTGSTIGYYNGIGLPISGDSQEQTTVTVAGNRTLVIEPGDQVRFESTNADGMYTVDQVVYDFVSGNTSLIFLSDVSLNLIATGYVIRESDLLSWDIGSEVFFSADGTVPSPLTERTPYFVSHVERFDTSNAANYVMLATSESRSHEVASYVANGDDITNMASTHVVRANNFGTGELRLGKVASTFQALQGAAVDTYWKRFQVGDSSRLFSGPVNISGIQSLIDFVHGYEAAGNDLGFVFSQENESSTDPVTGRMKGWQLELERLISSMFLHSFDNIEMDNVYEVRFIDPSTLEFVTTTPTNWLVTLPIRLSREDGNLPQAIGESGAPTFNQTVYYIIPDSNRRNAFKLAYSVADAAAGNFITFDVPLYLATNDTNPHVEYVTVPATQVIINHYKSETDLTKLVITSTMTDDPISHVINNSNTITFYYSEPVTGTISVAYAPTVYPSHTETLVQPALASSDSKYSQYTFDVNHNFDIIDLDRLIITYNTISTFSDQLIAAHIVNVITNNTLRFTFDEPVTGTVVINVKPAIRNTGGTLTARVIKFVPSFEGSINPYASGMWIATPKGIVRDVFEHSSYNGALRTNVYDQYGERHNSAGLLVLRQDTLAKMLLKDQLLNTRDTTVGSNGLYANPRSIAGARIVLSGIEHAMLLNDTAVDGSTIYDAFIGAPATLLYIEFEGQQYQTFRSNLGGYVIVDGKLVRNIEGMAEDLRYAYDTHETSEGSQLTHEARRSIGYDGEVDFLVDNNINKKSQFLFWKSMIKHKGTHVPLLAFLQGTDVTNIIVDEFWAYRTAQFGSAGEKTYPEMNLFVEDSAAEELRVEFLLPQETVVEESFTGVRLSDGTRWYNQPDVVANHPYSAFFLNAEVTHLDDTPEFIVVSEKTVYYVTPKNCDGIILLNHRSDGETDAYSVGSDLIKVSNNVYRVNIPASDTVFYNNCTVALIGYGAGQQDVATLVDHAAGTVVDRISLWDPARGLYDQQGLSAVDVQSTTDPATYNIAQTIDGQTVAPANASPWLTSQTGRTWMDTSRIGYVPYSDNIIFPAIENRSQQWGALEPWADIHLYEWTESSIPPELWDAAVKSSKGTLSGTPYRLPYTRNVTGWTPQLHKHETHTALLLLLNQFASTKEVSGTVTKIVYNATTDTTDVVVAVLPTLYLIPNLEVGETIFISGNPTNSAASTDVDGNEFVILKSTYASTWTITVPGKLATTAIGNEAFIPMQIAMTPFKAIDFDQDESVSIYINGVFYKTVSRSMVFESLFGTTRQSSFLSSQITLVRSVPAATTRENVRGDNTELFPYSAILDQDPLSSEKKTKYYFWVRDKTTNDHPERKISIGQASKLLKQTTRPYMIWQDLRTEEEGYGIVWGNVFDQLKYGLPGRYRDMIVRGLNGRVTENNRYTMRFTRDFTLRDTYDGALKSLHDEWKMFRQEQTYKIDNELWLEATAAVIGHEIDKPDILIPSLNRVLYDRLNATSTRFGFADGQAMFDQQQGLNTIVYHLVNETGPFSGFGGVEYISRYDLTDSVSIEQLMSDVYSGCTVSQVNYLFFELLQDALSVKREYERLMKTSWVSLQIIRDLNASTVQPLRFDRPSGCIEVLTTTTTTIPPAPIDDVDIIGCAAYTTTTTLAPQVDCADPERNTEDGDWRLTEEEDCRAIDEDLQECVDPDRVLEGNLGYRVQEDGSCRNIEETDGGDGNQNVWFDPQLIDAPDLTLLLSGTIS